MEPGPGGGLQIHHLGVDGDELQRGGDGDVDRGFELRGHADQRERALADRRMRRKLHVVLMEGERMRMARRRPSRAAARGFTLMEMMVSLGVLLAVMLSATPFAAGWSNQSKINRALGEMRQAMGKARGLALRNPGGASGTAAATLCLATVGGAPTLFVHPGVPASCGLATGSAAFAWSSAVPGGADTSVTVNSAGSPMGCIGFSNYGVPMAASVGLSACALAKTFGVSKGGIDSGQMSII